jgi:hypothetical protein
MSLLGAGSSYGSAAAEAKARKAMQVYNNKMAHIADAMNQNAITTNVTMAIQQSARQAPQLQQQAMQVTGQVEVQAAATDTVGRSVNQALKMVARGAANQEYARREDLKTQFLQADEQRRQSALSAKLQEDHSYIPKPNAASALFSAGTSILGAYGQNFGFGGSASSGSSSTIAPGNYGKVTGYGDTRTLLNNKYAALF